MRILQIIMTVYGYWSLSVEFCEGCIFDPCQIPDICKGKECVVKDDCSIECRCGLNSTLPECLNEIATTTVSSSQQPKSVDCPCIHGNCTYGNALTPTCVCEDGWSGNHCDQVCDTACDEGFKCTIVSGIFQVCLPVTTSNIITSITSSTPNMITEISSRNYNVCDAASYTPHPMSERMCTGGWLCIYGVCRSEGDSVWCECDPGAIGQNCHTPCCRQCDHGSCYYVMEQEREICNCEANYSGPYCERWDPPTTHAPPKDVTWPYWVVGACALVLVLLIVLMVVVPYILWRNRVILVMKVVHYFQGYEDDDDRQWDAFISYKSIKADETFVVKTLLPKLESELGFRVNVHFRDFVPGETIANNIISAVQGSRRTVMVISPAYVTSEFTKFEYQVAQQEMLKRKHRIIPVLLDDISEVKETMDPNLKIILDSVTYLEWPKSGSEKKLDKFWKRLELSMPKIKNKSVDPSALSSVSNGPVSMTKPDAINIAFIDDHGHTTKLSAKHSGVYNTIDDSAVEGEEMYDTLNENEMQSKVLKKKLSLEQNGYYNGIKLEL